LFYEKKKKRIEKIAFKQKNLNFKKNSKIQILNRKNFLKNNKHYLFKKYQKTEKKNLILQKI